MNIENKINNQLNKYPRIKKVIKKSYQILRYSLSSKIKSEGNIVRITPDDDYEYFYGYYDKSPWSSNEEYILCLRVKCTYKDVAPKEKAEIILINTLNKSVKKIAETSTWNIQQGCMLQWLGPNFNERIIYNDFRDKQYCSVILNIFTGEETVINSPIYDVSKDGTFALTLDFSRLHRLRPGYGYSNLKDKYESNKLPDDTCIWKVDLIKNITIPLLKYTDFYNFETKKEMVNAEHKVNHIMISPNGKRFMVLHRWYQGSRKYTRLLTCNIDGTEMFNLSDDDMVSHCFWKNNEEIIAFEKKLKIGNGYFLMKDKTNEFKHLWTDISNDGHPSYSPNQEQIVIDSYPNSKRISIIKIMNEDREEQTIAKVFSPFRYDNDLRCDLHPRWDRIGEKICFDSVFDGKRALYVCYYKKKNLEDKNE